MKHPARAALERPFVIYVANGPSKVQRRFYALREAMPDVAGVALFDKTGPSAQGPWRGGSDLVASRDRELLDTTGCAGGLGERRPSRRSVRRKYRLTAMQDAIAHTNRPKGLLWHRSISLKRPEIRVAMRKSNLQGGWYQIRQAAQRTLGKDIWSADIKATDEVLDQIFRRYFELIKEPLRFRKADYHGLVRFVPSSHMDPEIGEKLEQNPGRSAARPTAY